MSVESNIAFALVLLSYALWLVNKTRATFSTNWTPNQNQSCFGCRRFTALGASYMYLLRILIGSLCCLHLLRLPRVITLVLVLRHSIGNCSKKQCYYTNTTQNSNSLCTLTAPSGTWQFFDHRGWQRHQELLSHQGTRGPKNKKIYKVSRDRTVVRTLSVLGSIQGSDVICVGFVLRWDFKNPWPCPWPIQVFHDKAFIFYSVKMCSVYFYWVKKSVSWCLSFIFFLFYSLKERFLKALFTPTKHV